MNGRAAGNYYLKVYGYNGAVNAAYTYKMNLPAAPMTDRFEVNNTLGTASNLGIVQGNRFEPNLSIHNASNQDYYKFRVAAPATASNTDQVAFSHAAGDIDVELPNASGTVLASSAGSDDVETLNLAGLQPGQDYFVHVYGYSGASNPNYSLTFATPTGPTADAY